MIFERKDFRIGSVTIHLLNFLDFDPSNYLNQLTDIETERFFSFTNIHRKKEFVATRILRHELFGLNHIHYDLVGAPYIKDEGYISISHTKNIVGIAFCKEFKIGLDIEPIRDKIAAIKHKFLGDFELNNFDCNSISELTKLWSAKESLYKVSGINSINFRTELKLEKITNEIWKGSIKSGDKVLTTDLHIFEFENRIFSVNINACEKTHNNI